VTFTTKRW